MNAMTLTQNLGAFIAFARHAPVSEEAMWQTGRALADTIGTMLAGRREESVVKLAQTQRLLAGSAQPDVLAWALYMGTAAHVLDYDNVALGGHPAAVLVSALMALVRQFPLSGREFTRAYLVGYEVWGELRRRHPVLAHEAGWHPSGLIGPLAASAACATALGLDEKQACNALAIAASQSAGLMANFGTPVKALHIGFAAKAGLFSALLARQGISGNQAVLEQENGWLATWSPHHPVDRTGALTWPREGWLLARQPAAFKYYPVCYAAHRVIDAARELHLKLPTPLSEAVQIRIVTSQRHSNILRFRQPENRLQSCFSLEFAVVSALLDGELTLLSLQDDKRAREDVQQLMTRCERITSSEMDPDREGFARQDRIDIILRQGEILSSHPVQYATGDAHAPLSDEQLRQKFIACLHWGGITREKNILWSQLMNISALELDETFPFYRLAYYQQQKLKGCGQ